jgi:Zn-finger domain-containing protein
MDNIKRQKNQLLLKNKIYEKLLERYGSKIRNRISDLHKKFSVFLTSTYKEITIGKMSTSRMISNKTSNIRNNLMNSRAVIS